MECTPLEKSIMQKIIENGGEWIGCFSLSLELDSNYFYIRSRIKQLEHRGFLSIQKDKSNSPLCIRVNFDSILPCGLTVLNCPICSRFDNPPISKYRMEAYMPIPVIPDLTFEEEQQAVRIGTQINFIRMHKRAYYIAAICKENMALLKEVNAWRVSNGMEPRKIYDPKEIKIDLE